MVFSARPTSDLPDFEYDGRRLRFPVRWSDVAEVWEEKATRMGMDGWELIWMTEKDGGIAGMFKRLVY